MEPRICREFARCPLRRLLPREHCIIQDGAPKTHEECEEAATHAAQELMEDAGDVRA